MSHFKTIKTFNHFIYSVIILSFDLKKWVNKNCWTVSLICITLCCRSRALSSSVSVSRESTWKRTCAPSSSRPPRECRWREFCVFLLHSNIICAAYISHLSLALRLLRDGKSAVRKMYAGCAPRFGGEIKCTHAFLSHQLGAEHSFSIIFVYGLGMAWPRLAIKVDLLHTKNCILSICTKNSQPFKCIMISFAIIFNTTCCLFLVL